MIVAADVTKGPRCLACGEAGAVVTSEHRDGLDYRVFSCTGCASVYCPDHYESVSPDYFALAGEDITLEHLWRQGDHKADAYRQFADVLSGLGSAKGSILDAGCGAGGFLRYARQVGFHDFHGFDASHAQVSAARREFPACRQAVSPAAYRESADWPLFDVVTLWDVVEHLRDPRSFVRELRPLCSPRTLVYVSTPNGRCELLKYRIRRSMGRRHTFVPWEHVFYFSPGALDLVFRDAGFHPIESGAVECYRRTWGVFEAVRRAGFRISAGTPYYPQHYAVYRTSV